jgi:tetratricopeptide (TPR) repeat protein
LVRRCGSRSAIFVVLFCCGLAAEAPEAMQHARKSYELAQRGDLAQAAEEMKTAIRLAPENPVYVTALGGIAARQWEAGELEASRENALLVIAAQLSNARAKSVLEGVSLDLGAALARERRFKAGVLLARDTVKRFPDSASAHQMLGLFETRNQQNVAAVAAYKRALELAPDAAEASVGLGIAQTMAGLAADAVRTFEAGIAKWPSDAMHYQAYGVLLVRMAETGGASESRAASMLRKALELNPSLAEAHYQLGQIALAHDEIEKSIEHFLAALQNGDTSGKVHFALSRAYRRAGKEEEAAKHAALFREQKRP